jgi:hypothetical protein
MMKNPSYKDIPESKRKLNNNGKKRETRKIEAKIDESDVRGND